MDARGHSALFARGGERARVGQKSFKIMNVEVQYVATTESLVRESVKRTAQRLKRPLLSLGSGLGIHGKYYTVSVAFLLVASNTARLSPTFLAKIIQGIIFEADWLI